MKEYTQEEIDALFIYTYKTAAMLYFRQAFNSLQKELLDSGENSTNITNASWQIAFIYDGMKAIMNSSNLNQNTSNEFIEWYKSMHKVITEEAQGAFERETGVSPSRISKELLE